jgi:GTP-binding protein
MPVLAVVGRPNVGKSTLVNRLLGRREAVVEDVAGVTRDRIAYDGLWNGRRFTLVDTGGWEPDAQGLQAAWPSRPRWHPHGRRRAAGRRRQRGRHHHRRGRGPGAAPLGPPVLLAATKVDDDRLTSDTAALWRLGLGEPHPVSGLHGRGSGDLLDAILAALPETPREDFGTGPGRPAPRRARRQANVGKSSLLNRVSARCARWCTTSPAPPSTRSTRSSSWTARCGASSTPPACASA